MKEESPELSVMRAFKEMSQRIPRSHSIAAAKWMLAVALDPDENLPGQETIEEAIANASKHQFTFRESVACSNRIVRLWHNEKMTPPAVKKHPLSRLALRLARSTIIGHR